jgi:hypothetical protein
VCEAKGILFRIMNDKITADAEHVFLTYIEILARYIHRYCHKKFVSAELALCAQQPFHYSACRLWIWVRRVRDLSENDVV